MMRAESELFPIVVFYLVVSMVVDLVPLKGGIGGIFYPPIGRKNTTYSPCLLGGKKCYRSHLLGEPETSIDCLEVVECLVNLLGGWAPRTDGYVVNNHGL